MIGVIGVQLLVLLPLLLVLGAGVALLLGRRDRVPPIARGLGIAGCLLLAMTALGQAIFNASLVTVQQDADLSVVQVGTLASVVGIGASILHAVGVGLLVAAALTGRGQAATWAPPSTVHGQP